MGDKDVPQRAWTGKLDFSMDTKDGSAIEFFGRDVLTLEIENSLEFGASTLMRDEVRQLRDALTQWLGDEQASSVTAFYTEHVPHGTITETTDGRSGTGRAKCSCGVAATFAAQTGL
jgi:hypothetical protein